MGGMLNEAVLPKGNVPEDCGSRQIVQYYDKSLQAWVDHSVHVVIKEVGLLQARASEMCT